MKNVVLSFYKAIAFIAVLSFAYPTETKAQCPMCKMSLQSNLQNGGTQGRGINGGIMYLLMTPYVLVGGIAYVWYRNKKRKEDTDLEEELVSIKS